jgi:hypothetical protein
MNKVVANSALIIGLVQAAIALAVAFGVNLTDAQTGAILGIFGAALALIGGWFNTSIPFGRQT